MRLLAVCVGKPQERPGKKMPTGINKQPVMRDVSVKPEGLEGDTVCNRKYHGGPEQAVCVEGNITRLSSWRCQRAAALPPSRRRRHGAGPGTDRVVLG